MKKKLIPILILFALCLCAPICAHADGEYSGVFTGVTVTARFQLSMKHTGQSTYQTVFIDDVNVPVNYLYGGIAFPAKMTFGNLTLPTGFQWSGATCYSPKVYTITFPAPVPLFLLSLQPSSIQDRQSITINYTEAGVAYQGDFTDYDGVLMPRGYELMPTATATSLVFTTTASSFQTSYGSSSTVISMPSFQLTQAFDAIAYSYGYDTGYSAAEDTFGIREYYARQEGYEQGHSDGYTEGKRDGLQTADNGTLYDLFAGLFDALTVFLTSFINFEIFGVNLLDFFKSLITIVLIILIVKLIKGAG